MSTQKETLWSKTGIERDSVARRVLNTSQDVANITVQALENGVSLETLLSLNVPVYRYKTQITIHGILPGLPADVQAAGYKAIIKNKNGTIGVRYVGIDAEKKQTLCAVSRMYKGRGFRASIDSQGFSVWQDFDNMQDLKAVYDTIDSSLFYGTVQALKCLTMWGSVYYRLQIDIDAIPGVNLWKVAFNLFACPSAIDFACKVARAEREQTIEQAKYKEESAKSKAEYEAKKAAAEENTRLKCQEFAASVTQKRLKKVPCKSGESFLLCIHSTDGPKLVRIFLRNVFGKLCYGFTSDLNRKNGTGLQWKDSSVKLAYWQQKADDGLLFSV